MPTLPPTAPGGQTYGARAEQERAQRAVPMGRPDPPVVDLLGPSQRPDEPITAGVPFGPGPGPEAVAFPVGEMRPQPGSPEDIRERLVGIYERFPNPGLRALIAALDEQSGRWAY